MIPKDFDSQPLRTWEFERLMDEACGDFPGHNWRSSWGLEAVECRFKGGEVIDGCAKYDEYVCHLNSRWSRCGSVLGTYTRDLYLMPNWFCKAS